MIELRKQRIALGEVIGSAVEISQPLIEERQHHLAVVEEPAAIYVEGDLDRLAQVVSNLLNNAAKYTPKGGEITLSTHLAGRRTRCVTVRDNGIGIAAELLPRVFDLFVQAEASQRRGHGGMGIGLALVAPPGRAARRQHRGEERGRRQGQPSSSCGCPGAMDRPPGRASCNRLGPNRQRRRATASWSWTTMSMRRK